MVPKKMWFHLESHFIYIMESQKVYKYKLESQINKLQIDIIIIFGFIIVNPTWNHKINK